MAINIFIVAKSYEEAVHYYEKIFDVECDAAKDPVLSRRDILYIDYKHSFAVRYIEEYSFACGLRADKIFATKEVMNSEWYKRLSRNSTSMRDITVDAFMK